LAKFRAEYPQLQGRFVVALPGRMTRLKGHHDFIAIIGTLVALGVDVVGMVVGGDDPKRPGYAQEVREKVAAENLQERILFLGHRSDMRELYAVSDCVLSLSAKPEAFGRTVLEALALGRPVVGYAHGGVAEILDALFPFGSVVNGDAKAVAARLLDVLQGRAPAVIRNERFLLADMQARTLALYAELAA
jgi:glycosyltransferase involved in cell wall biosynthesis